MFERYSERSRRVLFFARYECSQLGATTIEPEHVLLGVLREAGLVLRFFREGETAATIHARLQKALPVREKISTSVEIPFSPSCKEVLAQSASEADALKNTTIRPEHLVLAIVGKTHGAAARALEDAGIDPDGIRNYLRGLPDDLQERPQQGVMSAHVTAGGVVRQWKGVVKSGLANEYLRHLHKETLPSLGRLDGFSGASIMRRDVDDGTEFQVVTLWRSLDAIMAFAGEDVTRAVVPPAAQALMVRYDERAVHYTLVE